MKLLDLLLETVIKESLIVKKEPNKKGKFKPAFGGKYGPTDYYQIIINGKIIGELELLPPSNNKSANRLDSSSPEILSLYVDPDSQTGGYGTKLVKHVQSLYPDKAIYVLATKDSAPFWSNKMKGKLVGDMLYELPPLSSVEESLVTASGHMDGASLFDMYLNAQRYFYFTDNVKSVKKVITKIKKKGGKLVSKSGNYGLYFDGTKNYFLVDHNASSPESMFVGVMQVTPVKQLYNVAPKTAFKQQIYGVHWSNIATEKMGLGLGKLMYFLMFNHVSNNLQGALMSDSVLFKGSFKMWLNYMPTLAEYFGVVQGDFILPVSREELGKFAKSARSVQAIDGFVAMDNPPKAIRQMGYNVRGLSFFEGEYNSFYYEEDGSKSFVDFLETNEPKNIDSLIKKFGKPSAIGLTTVKSTKRLKTAFFMFNNAIIIVRDLGNKLSWTLL